VLAPLTLDRSDASLQMQSLMWRFGGPLLPILGLLALAGVLSTVLQIGLLFVPERLKPDLARLSPLAGLRRMLSWQGVARLGFGLFKVVVVAVVAGIVVYRRRYDVLEAAELELPVLARFVVDVSLSTALRVGLALFVLAILDYGFQRWDPAVIARRRAIQRQMALNRIGDRVPKADVVVTNPTELAVAIQYDPLEMAAPIVVAKGAGVLAQRIRRLALEHNIPVVERKPLAQFLYREVDVNRSIPDQSYAAVAEVLAYVYQLKGKKMPVPRAA
jgi:flagellar biosynthetic protein FlhB